MVHIAILKKSWGFREKILIGEKTIESRWYKQQRQPWNCIVAGETVYFKNSGEPVSLSARVSRVLQFDNLTPKKIKNILKKYGTSIGISKQNFLKFADGVKDKKYCILLFLKNPKPAIPFSVNKTGFGLMTAWITANNINKLKR